MKRAPHQPLTARYPLFQVALAFSAGIITAPLQILPGVALVCCSATLLAAAGMFLRRKLFLAKAFLTFAILCSGLCLAKVQEDISPNQLRKLLAEGTISLGGPIELTGVINGPVESAYDALYFKLRVEQLRANDIERQASGMVAFVAAIHSSEARARYAQLELRHGARLRIMTALRRTDSYRNPGVAAFTDYLDRKGYDASGFVKSPLLVERLDDDKVFLPLAWLYEWRAKLQTAIDSHFSRETAGVLDAALLGNRYNLMPETAERFRAGGTFHVLVISGLHISFIGAVVLLIARRLTKRKEIQFASSVLVLWAYTLAVGAEASVVRSALMFTLVALAPVIFRNASALNALGGAALVLLVWRPDNLFDPSFQLTFLSVLAIVVLAWPIMQGMSAIGSWQPTYDHPYPPACPRWLRVASEWLYWSERKWRQEMTESVYRYRLFKNPLAASLERLRLQRPARYAFNALVVSLSVQVVLLPLLVIYFHRLSLSSIILNIGVSLIMAALTLVALAALLILSLNVSVAFPLVTLANGLNWLMVHSVDPFARFGIASFRLPQYSGKAVCLYGLYYVPLVVLTIALAQWNPMTLTGPKTQPVKASLAFQLILIALMVLHPLSAGRPDGYLRVDFLDVGQGDSALLTMPDGVTLLIDGGGKPSFSRSESAFSVPHEEVFERESRSIGETVVSEYLWWRGLDSVDYVLATHADTDHIDGLSDVARNFKLRGALVARTPLSDPEFRKFSDTLKLSAVPLSIIGGGDVLRFGDVELTVVWPPAANNPALPSGNNDSLALRVRYGRHTLLFTGDIERSAEHAIVRSNQDLSANVVKVAHHGSKTSSIESFVAATRPQFAIISVGQTSVFGHPNKDVVERWRSVGANVMTTGHSGTISVISDGKNLRIETFVR